MTATTLHDTNARPSVGTVERERPALDPIATTPTPMVRVERSPAGETATPQPERVTVQGIEFTRERIELLKRTIAKGASDDELDLFLYQCQRLRLDPFARQCYFMKRRRKEGSKWVDEYVFEVAIDGVRLTAERTGEYQGQTDPEWCDVSSNDDGTVSLAWYPVWPFAHDPHAARVGVYRKGFVKPLYAVARWNAYVQTVDEYEYDETADKSVRTGNKIPNSMWTKRGPEQLAKCAESLALRQAFPNELSGVYTVDEMAQADNDETDETQPPREHKAAAPRRETHKGSTGQSKPAPRQPQPAQGAKREPTKAQTTKAAAAPEQSNAPRSLAFPFKPFRGILLDEKDAATGVYRIDYETLAKGGDAAMRAHNGEVEGIPPAERPRWLTMAEAISAECERRIAERDEALAKSAQAAVVNESQAPAATPADTSGASDAIETMPCPTCANNPDGPDSGCPDCFGTGKIEPGESFEG